MPRVKRLIVSAINQYAFAMEESTHESVYESDT